MNESMKSIDERPVVMSLCGGKHPPKEFQDRVERLLKLGEERGYKKPCEYLKETETKN